MGNGERVGVSVGADAKANTWDCAVRGRGALQVGNLRLAQHLCELGSPLRANVVVGETVKDGKGGKSERAVVTMGIDRN